MFIDVAVPEPPSVSFPNPDVMWWQANTGPRVSSLDELETYSGSFTTSANGQRIEGLKITGRLFVVHDDVEIYDTWVTGDGNSDGEGAVRIQSGSAYLEHLLVGAGAGNGIGIAPGEYHAYRCEITGCVDHCRIGTGYSKIEECYMHDLELGIPGAHGDGIQSFCCGGCSSGTTPRSGVEEDWIINNYIEAIGAGTAAVFFADCWNGEAYIEGNYIKGGNYCCRFLESGHYAVIRNNWIEDDSWDTGTLLWWTVGGFDVYEDNYFYPSMDPWSPTPFE